MVESGLVPASILSFMVQKVRALALLFGFVILSGLGCYSGGEDP